MYPPEAGCPGRAADLERFTSAVRAAAVVGARHPWPPVACLPLGGRTPRSSATARRPRARAAGRRVGRAEPWPQVHPGILPFLRGARAARAGL